VMNRRLQHFGMFDTNPQKWFVGGLIDQIVDIPFNFLGKEESQMVTASQIEHGICLELARIRSQAIKLHEMADQAEEAKEPANVIADLRHQVVSVSQTYVNTALTVLQAIEDSVTSSSLDEEDEDDDDEDFDPCAAAAGDCDQCEHLEECHDVRDCASCRERETCKEAEPEPTKN
jgi:hypothetical protein